MMVIITSEHHDIITRAVRDMYTAVAREPHHEFHFPTGRRALKHVGYPEEELQDLPAEAVESFAGVGYPFAADVIRKGDVVLDIGSGSGTDVLIAARKVGSEGKALGLDMTEAMREKARANARRLRLDHVRILEGTAEEIPLADGSVDVITSNGVINLVPDKAQAAGEIHRVLRPGGRLQVADIVVRTQPSAECRSKPRLWAECIVGATTTDQYLQTFREAGFDQVEPLSSLDYFRASRSKATRKTAADFGAHTIVFRAMRH
jgi:arsenite methyltransferase